MKQPYKPKYNIFKNMKIRIKKKANIPVEKKQPRQVIIHEHGMAQNEA